MIASLSASFSLLSLLLLIGMAYCDDQANWPQVYRNRIKSANMNGIIRSLTRTIHSSGIIARAVHTFLLLVTTWFLTCFMTASAHIFGGLYEMARLPWNAEFPGPIFIALALLVMLSVNALLAYGMLTHVTLYPLALGAVWARRGGSDKTFVALLGLAAGAAGILVGITAS